MVDLKKLDKLKNSKHVLSFKQGLMDIQTVIQEGNVKLFVKQLVAVLIIFLVVYYVSGSWGKRVSNYKDQMVSLRIQQESAKEYETNKKELMDLEPRFPDIQSKNEWLLSQILSIFKESRITPEVGTQTEDTSSSAYTVASAPVKVSLEFNKFAELLAQVENSDDFLKVSSFSLEKEVGDRLGFNKIEMKFNTIFPNEKLAEKLFTDYKELLEARNGQKNGTAASQKPKEGK